MQSGEKMRRKESGEEWEMSDAPKKITIHRSGDVWGLGFYEGGENITYVPEATIESLQRENDLFREKYLDEKYTAESLRTKIITPEMREKLERWANTIDNARAAGGPVRTAGLHQQRAGEIVDGIRDLLGEHGGMGDE